MGEYRNDESNDVEKETIDDESPMNKVSRIESGSFLMEEGRGIEEKEFFEKEFKKEKMEVAKILAPLLIGIFAFSVLIHYLCYYDAYTV